MAALERPGGVMLKLKRGKLVVPELGKGGAQDASREMLELHHWMVFTTHEREAYKSAGRKGQPDLVAVLDSSRLPMFIECKTGDGKPSAEQLLFHNSLRARGYEVLVIRDVSELKAYV